MASEVEREEDLELLFNAEDVEPYALETGDGFSCELLPELCLPLGAQAPPRQAVSEAPRVGCEPAGYNRERKSSREKQRRHELNVKFAALASAIRSSLKTERADLLQSAVERIGELEEENRQLKAQLLAPRHVQPAVAADAAPAPRPECAAAPALASHSDAHAHDLASASAKATDAASATATDAVQASEVEPRKRKRSPSPGDSAPLVAKAKACAGVVEHACTDVHELAVLQQLQLQGFSALQGLMYSPGGQLMLHPAAMLTALMQMQQMQTVLAQTHVATFPSAALRPPPVPEEEGEITHSHCA
jgi:hypothetical protein